MKKWLMLAALTLSFVVPADADAHWRVGRRGFGGYRGPVRGININHSEFEDFMFTDPSIQDFKCEIVTGADDLERLKVSVELKRDANEEAVSADLNSRIKNTFEVTPELVRLDLGSLAQEFEGAVKAPRFQDNRK